MSPFNSFLLKGAPTFAAVAGLFILLIGGIERRGEYLIPGSILFSSAMLAVQLRYRSNSKPE